MYFPQHFPGCDTSTADGGSPYRGREDHEGRPLLLGLCLGQPDAFLHEKDRQHAVEGFIKAGLWR